MLRYMPTMTPTVMSACVSLSPAANGVPIIPSSASMADESCPLHRSTQG